MSIAEHLSIHFRDLNPKMVEAWESMFTGYSDVQISGGEIFGAGHPSGPGVALVSPANSFGFMDGGIDLVYTQRFGWQLEERLRAKLAAEFGGELPVGCATLVCTEDLEIPWLVCAPTMRVPMDVSKTANAYLSFRAGLRAVLAHAPQITTVYCPGMGTAIGRMPVERSAFQMFEAYRDVLLQPGPKMGGLAGVTRHHIAMVEDQPEDC